MNRKNVFSMERLQLNKDCVVEAGGSRIEEGGTVTLCKIAMEKTAPIIMH